MSEPEVLDCELTLADWDKASLRFAGREFSGRPAFDEACLQRLRAALDPLEYGRELFEALLPANSELREGYRGALHHDPPRLVRLRLHLPATAPSALHALRWEQLYDPRQKIPLGCSREIAFSRSCAVPKLWGSAIVGRPRLLVALANPSNLADYGLPAPDPGSNQDQEARDALEAALAPLADLLHCEVLTGRVTAARLRDRLLGGRFHALHLQAHGALSSDRGACVALEGEDGRADMVDEATFSQIFERLDDLRLATLISCHSGLQSTEEPLSGLGPGLVDRGVPAVLAMRQVISFDAARVFCASFYRNLADSGLVDQAASEARNQLRLARRDSDEWGVPALFLRLADGRLWPAAGKPSEQGQERRETGSGSRSRQPKWPWSSLLDRIDRDNLIPFLGPGRGHGLLPSPEEIAGRLADGRHRLALDGRVDLPAVAQYLDIMDGRFTPHDKLSSILAEAWLERKGIADRAPYRGLGLAGVVEKLAGSHFSHDPDEPHRILAELGLSTYVTTNYDPFLAAALRWSGRPPVVAHYPLRDDPADIVKRRYYKNLQSTRQTPVVFHMYGGVEHDARSMVLTEDDYLDFVRATAGPHDKEIPMRLPHDLKCKLSMAMLLFLGYDVRRLDCRALLRGVVTHLPPERSRGRILVFQIDRDDPGAPDERELRDYIEGCCRKIQIEVCYGTVQDFLKELRGQLGGDRGHA